MVKVADRQTGAPSHLVQYSEAERRKLAGMVCTLFDHWGLKQQQQCELLGLSPNTRASLARYRRGEPLADNRDLLDRVGNLMGIHKSLRLLYPHNRDLAYRWPTARNQDFANQSPVEFMTTRGFLGIIEVRGYLDFLRGQ